MSNADTLIRNGWKTTEFWVGLISILLTAIFPDIPKESLYGVLSWVGGRSIQKFFYGATNGTRAWKTSEFWVSIGYSLLTYLVPGLPPEMLVAVQGWVLARTGVKVGTALTAPVVMKPLANPSTRTELPPK